MPKGTAVLGLI